MAVRFNRGGWEVRAYSPAAKALVYVGRAKEREDAEHLFEAAKQQFGTRRRAGVDWEARFNALEEEVVGSADDPDGAFVYFIQGKYGGPIKIGKSIDPGARLAALQSGSPEELEIRKVISGGHRKESELHRRFRRHRLWGEWFEPCEELLEMCDGVLDEGQKAIALDFLERQNEALRTRVAELEAALGKTRHALDAAWEASSVSPSIRLPEPQPRAGEDDDEQRSRSVA